MKNTRRILALLLALVMLLSFAACGSKNASENGETETTSPEREKIKVAVTDGPSALGLSKLKADRDYAYDVETYSDPMKIVSLMQNGEADIAALPLDLAADLYKQTNGGIKIIAVNSLGSLFVLSKDDSIKSIADLKGKTVYASGSGSMPGYIIDYLLESNELDPAADVDIQYKNSDEELVTMMKEGKADICVISDPFASKLCAADENIKKVISLTGEWIKAAKVTLAQSCIAARKEFIDQNPEAVTEFISFAEISVNYVNNYVIASKFLVDEGYFDGTAAIASGVQGCTLVFITGEKMKQGVSGNFKALFDFDPESVGGTLPDDGIYYIS